VAPKVGKDMWDSIMAPSIATVDGFIKYWAVIKATQSLYSYFRQDLPSALEDTAAKIGAVNLLTD